MNKAHEVTDISFDGYTLSMVVDGKPYRVDLRAQSRRLDHATQEQVQHVELSPSGYGLHWPDVDEDLSIDGLIGVSHHNPLMAVS